MKLWVKTRKIKVATLWFFAVLAVAFLLGDREASLPSLSLSYSPIAVAILLAAPASIIIGDTLNRRLLVESVGVRKVYFMDILFVITLALSTLLLGLLIDALHSQTLGVSVSRNIIGCFGLTMISYAIINKLSDKGTVEKLGIGTQASAVVPVLYIMISVLAGRTLVVGQSAWWAWPLADYNDKFAFASAMGLFVLGVLMLTPRFWYSVWR